MNFIRKFIERRTTKNTCDDSQSLNAKLNALNAYSMAGINALRNLNIIAQDLEKRSVEGDFVECGVCNGGSAGAISLALNKNRHVWLYDSFQGMPQTKDVDGDFAKKYVGLVVGSIEKVKKSMHIASINDNNYTIHKGWFQDSFKLPLPDKISILHVDCDWYDSVIFVLRTLYDRVQDNGIIVVDDFGHWEGCREAVYDFWKEKQIKPLIERFGHSQIFWIKNRIHNRLFAEQIENRFSMAFHH